MKKTNKKGFTIVELVIVIAVIAILAAVLIPTFSNIIDKANDSEVIQQASAAYKLYVANVDYVSGAKAKEDVVVKVQTDGETTTDVTSDDKFAYVAVKGGKLINAVKDNGTAAAKLIAASGTFSVINENGTILPDESVTITAG